MSITEVESVADFRQVSNSKIRFCGKRPIFIGHPPLIEQGRESTFDLAVVPRGDVRVATQFFAGGSKLDVSTQALVYGDLEVVTERAHGAVGGALAIFVRAAVLGGLRFEDATKAGLCNKRVEISAFQRHPLVIRFELGANLLAICTVVIGESVQVEGLRGSTPIDDLTITDSLCQPNEGRGTEETRVITLSRPLPAGVS